MARQDVRTHGDVDDAVLQQVADEVASHGNLGHVLAWGAAASPPRKPEDLVTQDEYTHDVIMLFRSGIYVVYDVT